MSRMSKLLDAVKNAQSGGNSNREDDKKFYYPARDKAGNGSATIRFLPGKTDDDIPFVKTYSHGFKGPTGKWYIEDCPTTIGEPCFCCEKNGEMIAPFGGWDTTPNNVKDVVRERKRKMQYVSNIIVIKDEKNPENEGKVFLFKYGQKIADKVFGMISPTFVDDDEREEFTTKYGAEAVDIFDLENGANFNFKIRKVDGQTNYDKSEFHAPSKLEYDVDLNAIEDLSAFTNPARFKSAEDLEKSFNRAVGNVDRLASKPQPVAEKEEAPVKVAKPSAPKAEKAADGDGDDEILDMMRKLEKDGMDDGISF